MPTMNKTDIQYMDFSWNPIAMRCDRISIGCGNCWHLRMANRLSKNPTISGYYQKSYSGKQGPALIESRLDDPLKRKKPARIGVQFMGDLGHDDTLQYWDYILGTMQEAFWHTYLLLTKRIENIKKVWYLDMPENIWLGVSVSTQEDADRLIPILLQIPAAVLWVSAEPLLENVILKEEWLEKIGWFVIGCESGPGRRPTKITHIQRLALQCEAAGVPCFVKQAEINGKIVSMPEILGKVWDQYPTGPGLR